MKTSSTIFVRIGAQAQAQAQAHLNLFDADYAYAYCGHASTLTRKNSISRWNDEYFHGIITVKTMSVNVCQIQSNNLIRLSFVMLK